MNELQLFSSPQFGDIRVSEINGEPIFCLSDLCSALKLSNSRKVKSQLDDDVTLSYPIIDSLGRTQDATFVNEAGMYTVILRSDSLLAKPMQKWVTGEVLPAIRKSGGYMVGKEESPEETMSRALLIAQDTLARQKQRLEMLQTQTNLQNTQLQIAAPKVEYYDAVLQSTSVYVADQVAKEIGMTAIKLNKKLCELGVLIRRNGQLVPTQKYCDKALTKTRTHHYTKSDGKEGTNCITVWTEKGRNFLHDLKTSGKL